MTIVLAACGGGSTAGPIAQSSASTTTAAPPPARTQPPVTAATPAATAPAPARRTPTGSTPPRPVRPPAGHARRTGAAADAPAPAATVESPAPAAVAAPAATALDERAVLVLTRRASPAHYFQQGTVTGTYDGTMAVEARITSKGVLVSFTATLPGGTISGRGVAVAILDSTTWPGLRGRAIVTGGTGRFAGIRGRGLRVTGRAKPDASRAHVRLAGTVSGI